MLQENIKDCLYRYYDAFHHQRWQLLGTMLADKFGYFSDHCMRQDKSQFLKFMSGNTWKAERYRISDIDITAWEEDRLALARYKTEFHGSDGGKSMTVCALETTVFQMNGGRWEILHSHTSNKVER